jgi:hypothetical protein
MAFVHGSKAVITVNSVSLTPYTDEVDFDGSVETAEVTVLGNTGKSYIPGLEDGSFKLNGKFDPTADAAFVAMNQVPALPVIYGPQGSTTGLPKYTCNAILAKYSLKTSVSGAGTFSADFTISGGWTRSVY